MKIKTGTMRLFKCLKCGGTTVASKLPSKGRTYPGHFKGIYCFKCKEKTKHVQVTQM